MEIKVDDLTGVQVKTLIAEHLQGMAADSPPESIHALNLDGLKKPEITFWCAWEGEDLLGCGAIKELDPAHAELKSMRTASAHLRKGVARKILAHIMDVAVERGYKRVSLETGSMDSFIPARKLYEDFGFEYCEPFADYTLDPNSAFMTKTI
ncbi:MULTISPECIES: GNAT family N-acetyltransferase [Paenibacillus]|uniref:GNAT family N-acetyltransferase n=1 Tax=Paenibacillus TaxID=44249 RepID=UPI000B82A7EA|nr:MULTISPECIES: GNAT family N-acetyltransferase [Paenibacillus]PRA02846.1 N-acetyltransferase [Paenibacillus sp. MYb63]PRA45653.1 N-acetyltransferase [Paenibacillus sp. MYb67]QZN77976.1 GNAT family N-acetyltransferase [Paenibacillus sp. DR312]